jgi:hypothetical protein
MNFQSVYVGQSVNEAGVAIGGYKNAAAPPSTELLHEIEYLDAAVGEIVSGLKNGYDGDRTWRDLLRLDTSAEL